MASLGREPLRIDILNQLSGITFAQAWRGRVILSVDELKVPFIGRAELDANKRASGRSKDLLDLELLAEFT